MAHINKFHKELEEKIKKHGSLRNAHAHICRAFTAGEKLYAPPMSLNEKQSYTGTLHRSQFYEKENLYERIKKFLVESEELGINKIDSFIDVATDIPLDDGLGALNVALQVKNELKENIDFKVGAYPIFGFKDSDPKRWEIFLESVKLADFIGTLPERDDPIYYRNGKDHIGFEEHFKRTLKVAVENNKPIHYHLDQQNSPLEFGTETLIEAIRWSEHQKTITEKGINEPFIWAVHSISPSCYNEERFNKLLEGLKKYNIGVICCPTAAISMRQLSIYNTPTHNCIANILPMLEQGIPVRIGTDNVDDNFLRLTKLDIRNELDYFANCLRFDQNPSILAKLGCGKLLDSDDVQYIKKHLEVEKEFLKEVKSLNPQTHFF